MTYSVVMQSLVDTARIGGGVHIPETLTRRGRVHEVKLSPHKATFLRGFLSGGDIIMV